MVGKRGDLKRRLRIAGCYPRKAPFNEGNKPFSEVPLANQADPGTSRAMEAETEPVFYVQFYFIY